MIQNSDRSADTPWGERPASPPAWWRSLLTVPALLGHIVIMLAAVSVLTVVNLLTGPGVWWSLAILVIWLAVVIVHTIGVASVSLLLDEEEAPPEPRAGPVGPALPNWLPRPNRERSRDEPQVPLSWELTDDANDAWPATTPETAPDDSSDDDEKVPWRAATDIAWLRRPRSTAHDADPPASEEASS